MLPRNFSVSVIRFLNWGLFLVVYKCETEDSVPYVWLVYLWKKLYGWLGFSEKKILTARHLGCLRFSSSELHAVSCYVAVDRLNRGRWSALIKMAGGWAFCRRGSCPPFAPSPLSIRLFSGSVKTDRPVEMFLIRADVILFSQIRNQNRTCAGCCNFFHYRWETFCVAFFFFFFFFFFF